MRGMKTLALLTGASILALTFSSCEFYHEKFVKNAGNTTAFLADSKTAPATSNVSGHWYTKQFGEMVLEQAPGGKLTGKTDDFTVQGIVSKRMAYIALIDDKWTFYTLKVQKTGYYDLVGFSSDSVPFSDKDKQPVHFRRIGE